MQNLNADIGTAAERLFKNTIGNHHVALNALREYFGIKGELARAYVLGNEAGKTDVYLRFTDGATLNANVKAYKAGFNQLTRLPIASFCTEFALDDLRGLFEAGVVRVAAAGRRGRLILPDDEERIVQLLTPLAERIVRFSITRLENPELLVLFNRPDSTFHIFDIQEILDNLNYTVTVTRNGVIRIGEFVTIQRKGGNGVKYNHIAKTSLRHPGNQLQVKMKVDAVVRNLRSITSYRV